MSRRLPSFDTNNRICVICEGDEEYAYLNRLDELGVWDDHYRLDLVNAKGNGNIPAHYQDKYQNDSSDIVLVFCDTDREPYEQYEDIKRKIDEFHGIEGAAAKIIVFGNPCTMDIIIKHWADIDLKSPAKKTNAPIIEQHTGVANYRAKKDQIATLMELVTTDNYEDMKSRIETRSSNDEEMNSNNFDYLISCLDNADDRWISRINQLLDEGGAED